MSLIRLDCMVRMKRLPAMNKCNCSEGADGVNPVASSEILFIDGKVYQISIFYV